MAEVNPLAFIGRSQPGPSTELNKLLSGLGQIKATGREQQANTRLTNEGALARTALPLGLDPSGPSFGANLDLLRQSLGAKRGAETGSLMQRGGFAATEPQTPVLPGRMFERGFTGGADLPGTAQAKAAGEVAATLGSEEQIKDVIGADKQPVGTISQRTTTKRRELKGKAKSVDSTAAQQIINQVKVQLGVSLSPEDITVGDDGYYHFTVNGKGKRVKIP